MREGANDAMGPASPVGLLEWTDRREERLRPVVGAQLEIPVGSPALIGDHMVLWPYVGAHLAAGSWTVDGRMGGHYGTHTHRHPTTETIRTVHTHTTGAVETHTTTVGTGPGAVQLWNGSGLLDPHGNRELQARLRVGPTVGQGTFVGAAIEGVHVFDRGTAARNPWVVGPVLRQTLGEHWRVRADLLAPFTVDRRVDLQVGISATATL